jgi:nucleotide-binding universal stress UspA family protein
MSSSWIVGVDGSEASMHALRWAREHASRHQATTVAICVGGDCRPAIEDPEIELRVRAGRPAAVLLAESANHSLLVVGTRGRGGFAGLALGSVSLQVATHASVPVAVVPAAAPVGPIERVVVGMDGSPQAIAALRWAVGFVPADARIVVIGAWQPSNLATPADQADFPALAEGARERFDNGVDQVERAQPEPRVIERRFSYESPRVALWEASRHAELTVVGARGHGAIGSVLLGSVSSWLLHHAPCATVVVPG